MSRSCLAAVAVAVVAASAAPTATGGSPLPGHPVGDGHQPTRARATIFGEQVRIRSALVWVDGFGDVSLLLSPDRATCASISSGHREPYVLAWLHSNGRALRPGQPVTGRGSRRVVVSFSTNAGVTAPVAAGVVLRLTRIDTRPRGVWHGMLQVPATIVHGQRFAFAGTFAARWCSNR